MTRRQVSDHDDGLIDGIAVPMLIEQLEAVLRTISTRKAQVAAMVFGLDGNWQHSVDEVSAKCGLSHQGVLEIFSKTLAKLRHPSRAGVLADYYDCSSKAFINGLMAAGRNEFPLLVKCEHHGYTAGNESSLRCEHCPCLLELSVGRPRRFCSAACRQGAYRRRQKEAS